MPNNYSSPASRNSSLKNVPLEEFANWPLGKRREFVLTQMSSAPSFIVESLLRAA